MIDEHGEIQCDRYKKADNGVFSDDEKAEAYMLASQSIIEKENPKAAKLIGQYLGNEVVGSKMKVFSTWREDIKVRLAEHSEEAKIKFGDTPVTKAKRVKITKYDPRYNVKKMKTEKNVNEAAEKTDSSASEDEEGRETVKMDVDPKLPDKVLEEQRRFEVLKVFGSRKYKPVAIKVRPVKTLMLEEFVVKRNITRDPLAGMPMLDPNPPEFKPSEKYTAERAAAMEANHDEHFLRPEEMNILHDFVLKHEDGFAWEAREAGHFKKEFFPPVKFAVLPHEPWVERNIPIPPRIFHEVCKVLKGKIDAGVYEPLTSSCRSHWFCVVKKDGKSLRIVYSLEP
ncbi:hypothetical protein BT96DRAFT_991735 [Gymnopus androsaceus JB14]|uniref:DNA/RNA polymerase n=1 Tax=Gymnopus androsaceus JB14 TaxID=1447944 RepID=A0A6A4HVZ3_9AGAR|nr:hypothetical protein BT96DRAFT_991735 [Gymnopus androsaceus JB14]